MRLRLFLVGRPISSYFYKRIRLERGYRHADGRRSSVPQMFPPGNKLNRDPLARNHKQCSSSWYLHNCHAVARALSLQRQKKKFHSSPCRNIVRYYTFSSFSMPSTPPRFLLLLLLLFLSLLFLLHLILFELIIVLLPPVTGASIILEKGHARLSLDPISRPSPFFLRTPPGFVYPPLV